jgi:crotonobetainyl-CoA:carnitine CoA-transferase CaiB-like acyl-CoA transferase
MGRDDLAASNSPYVTLPGRLSRAVELDELIAAWTRGHDRLSLTHRLQALGIPAGPVMDAADMRADPHLRQRDFFIAQERPGLPTREYPRQPFRFAEAVLPSPARAPLLGEHTRDVLRELLDMSDTELDALEVADVIGTVPVAARVAPQAQRGPGG